MTKPSPARLNIGCGRKPMAGAVNLDISDRVGADVVHDVNQAPWPFAPDTFHEVHAYDVLEHVADVPAALDEIHRIAKAGAVVHITLPHFSSANAFTDVTHRHWFGWFSFDPFTTDHALSHYASARFRMRQRRISFYSGPVNGVLFRLANRWPAVYERRWAWICPAWFLYFELEVVK
jgi:predicted SAM-dependent methyltransferase